ncbi:response regulator [Andreprevotia chitinilytica]|uniref:response regulator n=1 Tax=Andreprevotia chitinilytica TaxID=396808 RepID=UPI00055404BA|nr:response regulator [Andreprevotia chitinilytica]
MTKPILIVEDEPKIAELLGDYLHADGFETVRIARGDDAHGWLQQHQAELVLLDLMLPGLPGMEVCKRLRQHSSTPVIMVSARVEEIDRLLGLELGADDYICKPFSPREVVARVRTVLRRAQRNDVASAAPQLILNALTCRARIGERELALTAIEYQLLQLMSRQPGRLFSRAQLIDGMYNDHRIVTERTVDSHIKKLRKKMETAAPRYEWIHSSYGLGYRYEVVVRE